MAIAAPLPTGLHIGGQWISGDRTFDVLDKFRGTVVATVTEAGRDDVAAAAAAAAAAARKGPPVPFERAETLLAVARLVDERRADFAEVIVAETGFTLGDAKGEIDRCLQTLRLSAEEAKRISGEMIPFGGAPGASHRLGFTLRVPVGIVCAITPFNSPLNTVCHKVAPAFAAGNAVILKPAAYTPLTAALLVQAFCDAGIPAGFMNLIQGPGNPVGNWLLEAPEINFYTFTGSTAVGKHIQVRAGLRRTQMELGSIASTVICKDADIDRALPKLLNASFRKAGQVCTSIQRLYVHRDVFDEVEKRFVEATRKAGVGDPRATTTLTGPMISLEEAQRVEQWIAEAVAGGATLLAGGRRDGAVVAPTILRDLTGEMRVMQEEIFGPVVCLLPFDDFEDLIEELNTLPYGLAVGIFTNDLTAALSAAGRLEYGGVHINDTSSSRVDLMPYGGTKQSGFGREGPRYAIEEMSELRMISLTS